MKRQQMAVAQVRRSHVVAALNIVFAACCVCLNEHGIAVGQQSLTRPRSSPVLDLITAGKPDSALAVARASVAMDSNNTSALFDLAEAEKATGKRVARRTTLERILKLQPRNVDARLELATDFYDAGQLDSASAYAHAALNTSNRSSAAAFYRLGTIHSHASRLDSALVYFKRAWAVLPNGELY